MAPRGLEYTPRKRSCIVALHKQGLSIREIAAEGYGTKSWMANVLKRYAATATWSVAASLPDGKT